MANELLTAPADEEVTDDFGDVGVTAQPTAADAQIPAADTAVPEGEPESEGQEHGPVEPQEPVEAPAETPAAEVEWPEALLNETGLTKEVAAAQFGSPDALERAIKFHDAQMMAVGRSAQPTPQVPVQGIPQPQETAKQPWKSFEVPKDEKGEPVWNDDTIEVVQALNKHWEVQLASLMEKITPGVTTAQQFAEGVARMRQAEMQQQAVKDLDERITGLGEQWVDVFGKGTGPELFEAAKGRLDHPAIQARIRLDSAMAALQAGRQAQGLQPLPRDQLFARALRAEFSDKHDLLTRREGEAKVSGRHSLMTARPTQRKTPAAKPDQRAVDAVDKMLRKKGRIGLDMGDEAEAFDDI